MFINLSQLLFFLFGGRERERERGFVVAMAAEVSSLVRILNGYYCKDDQVVMNETGKSTALITQDFLGGSSISSKLDDSQELDLDLQVPNGWEKRLDLKSGKVYIQPCNSPKSSSQLSPDSKNQANQTVAKFQDLNFLPSSLLSSSTSSSSSSSSKRSLNLFDETSLDLKLVPSSLLSSSSSSSLSNNQSVCTLDKVKFALERAERNLPKKRSFFSHSSSPSNSSSPSKVNQERENGGEKKSSASPSGQLFAAGCPSCLLYVMISKNNSRCPRCDSTVPLPMMKKPRIDLNISI